MLGQIDSHTYNMCHVDSLLLVVVGSYRGAVEPIVPNARQSILLDLTASRFLRYQDRRALRLLLLIRVCII